MSTTDDEEHCVRCEDDSVDRCVGCSQDFCPNHYFEHREELSKQLEVIENNRNTLQHMFNEYNFDEEENVLMKSIDRWEEDSFRNIREKASILRQNVGRFKNECIYQMKFNLSKLTDQLRKIRRTSVFHESHLQKLNEELEKLKEKLYDLSRVIVQEHSGPLINKISMTLSYENLFSTIKIPLNAQWEQNGLTVAGGNGPGKNLNQLTCPFGVYFNYDDQMIYVADSLNDRIVQWKYGAPSGHIIVGAHEEADVRKPLLCAAGMIIDEKNDSLIICDRQHGRVIRWDRRNKIIEPIIRNIHCQGLTMDINGNIYASDTLKNEVRRLKQGDIDAVIVAGGNKTGNSLNQLDYPSYIFVDEDLSVYISDSKNHRVMKWKKDAKEGTIVAGGNGQGNGFEHLNFPQGVIVDRSRNVYVADRENCRVMCWPKGSREGRLIIGGNGEGNQANQFKNIQGLSFDRDGNLWVADTGNHRIQKFNIHLQQSDIQS